MRRPHLEPAETLEIDDVEKASLGSIYFKNEKSNLASKAAAEKNN